MCTPQVIFFTGTSVIITMSWVCFYGTFYFSISYRSKLDYIKKQTLRKAIKGAKLFYGLVTLKVQL